jgi:hypothetical protein
MFAFDGLIRSTFLPAMPIPISLDSHFRIQISVLYLIDGDAWRKGVRRLISDQS